MNEKIIINKLMKLVMKAAKKEESPVAAVIVYKNRIISSAYNRRNKSNKTIDHAEIIAINKANQKLKNWRLNKCSLYVTIEPCPMCAAALRWAQISKIVYGASDPKRGYSLFSPNLLHPKTIVESGIMADECGRIVSDFFKSKRK